MSAEQVFQLVGFGRLILPIAVTFGVLAVPWPRNVILRSSCAVLIAWSVSVLYTALVYNPAGIALGHQLGQHFPEAKYDNNTISVMLLAGWFLPVVTAATFFVARYFWLRRHKVGA